MALNNRTDLVIDPYKPVEVPSAVSDLGWYVRSELARLERIVNELAEAVPQVADNPPSSPRRGLQRYAVSPWNPGSGSDRWYYWNGSAWALL